MSCFVMNAEPVAALADYIADLLNRGWNAFQMDAPDELKNELRNCIVAGRFDETEIYNYLYALNIAAYRGRYLENYPEVGEETETFEAYKPNRQHGLLYGCLANEGWEERMLKRLDCFLYQCAEDPVYGCPLYKALDELANRLAGKIARSKPEYENAEWGE